MNGIQTAYSKFEVVKPKATDSIESEPIVPKPSWLARRLHDLRLRIMADTPTKSYFNPTMVGAWCSVITLIMALVTALVTCGILVGMLYQQVKSLEAEAVESRRIATEAIKLATYAAKDADVESGHADKPQERKK